ncbi:cupin domain-containing protein [Peribacillus butanolivorans]|uniref:cupin domain-containing protein n=1 Tax=Peribacillus butanolivorans TaxID=421767 RepID=UPI00364FC3E5
MNKVEYTPKISKYQSIKSYELDDGVFFQDMMVQDMGPKTLIVGLATFEPGKSLPCHIHNVEESVTILKGNAYCDVEGVRTALEPYDTSFIPANIPHRFVNSSDTEELIILWAYSQIDDSFSRVNIDRITVPTDRCMLPKS